MATPPSTTTLTAPVTLPRITITFCTQCKWLLRAAWLQQELLSTFGTTIGEIALIPSTGGIFKIHLTYLPVREEHTNEGASEVLIWDRKAEGGFPEAKVLKQRVRDLVEPGKGLGHSDTPGKKSGKAEEDAKLEGVGNEGKAAETPDLGRVVREEGVKNPLAMRMRPELADLAGKGDEKQGRDDCEDCK